MGLFITRYDAFLEGDRGAAEAICHVGAVWHNVGAGWQPAHEARWALKHRRLPTCGYG
jgi:hypothetical protein